jgi:hypothetical protein
MSSETVDRIKPIIDSTYPALMAGLCLTFLSISPDALKTKWLMFFVSSASLSFTISSIFLFLYSLHVITSEETDKKRDTFWSIMKYAFILGISFLLLSTIDVVYNLWINEFIPSLKSYFSEPSTITNLKNSTNLTVFNQT